VRHGEAACHGRGKVHRGKKRCDQQHKETSLFARCEGSCNTDFLDFLKKYILLNPAPPRRATPSRSNSAQKPCAATEEKKN
jgi:hypothetical protein